MEKRKRIGQRDIKALMPGQTIWDSAVVGFGARRQKGNAVSYVVFYRTKEGRQRWHTIGRHGAPWTPDLARTEAIKVLGRVADDEDPAGDKRTKRKAASVSELCDFYLKDAEAGRVLTRFKLPKKAGTLTLDRGRIERHIKPLIGNLKVAAVTATDIENLLHDIAAGRTAAIVPTKQRGVSRVRGGKATANRVVRLLGAVFSYAVKHKMRTDNPVRGVTQFEDGRKHRRLSSREYRALGKALSQAEKAGMWPAAVAATRFIALTGWRSGEVLKLRWNEVDLERRMAFLADTKTGKSLRPLSRIAADLVHSQSRLGDLIFPATRGNGNLIMSGYKKFFGKIAKVGDLPRDITPHSLRHSFASVAADHPPFGAGLSDLTIGALIGHKGRTITASRHIHCADPVLLAAADMVADLTVELMTERHQSAKIVVLGA
jgi:integrase